MAGLTFKRFALKMVLEIVKPFLTSINLPGPLSSLDYSWVQLKAMHQFAKFILTSERATRLQDFEEIGWKVVLLQIQRREDKMLRWMKFALVTDVSAVEEGELGRDREMEAE